ADAANALGPRVHVIVDQRNIRARGRVCQLRAKARHLFADRSQRILVRIDCAIEALDERRPMLFAPGGGPAPFKVKLPVAAVRQIAIGLQAQALGISIGRNVGILLRADESLVRARSRSYPTPTRPGIPPPHTHPPLRSGSTSW